ncbi:MAG: PIN domain-containing protein [Gammaproteobacteria bacterium]|nr:PIN domain-containing protein [Gammaproteobacteria bacterium]
MRVKPFLDTNILIYAFAADDPRSERAEALLAAGGVISVQVLNEFVNVSRRRLRRGWDEIEKAVRVLRTLLEPPVPVTIDLHEAAVTQARNHGFAFYDALIIAAAVQSGCKVIYTEDMHDGQTIGDLKVLNPFR